MRLNKLYRPAISHEEIIAELRPLLENYSKNRHEGEKFGDFCIRKEYEKKLLRVQISTIRSNSDHGHSYK